MDFPCTSHHSERRERAREEFREAGRELRWAMLRYGDAQQAVGSGIGSPAELVRARQAWGWALTEWVRTLVIREEVLDGAGTGPDDGRVRTVLGAAGGPFPAPGTLREARLQVELLSTQYERVRRGGSSDEAALARELWARALSAWARMLIAQEEAADEERIDRYDGTVGTYLADVDPSEAGRAARRRQIVAASRERARAANIAARGRPDGDGPPPLTEGAPGGGPPAPARRSARPSRRAG
ncbi:hypothetical protein [Planomonospora alba]|uniref:hypothetical protein n=1 Tax=Planomonospora alba TaxID=161354 RepID=UPI0031E95DF7